MASSSQNPFEESLDDTFDEYFDQYFDQCFDQTFENLAIGHQEEARKQRKKRAYIERNREEGHNRLWDDYFSETPTYPENFFRRRFRMNKRLFMHIVDRLSSEVQYFQEKKDGIGRNSLSALQKCTAAIRVLAYGSAADTVDEYLQLGETTTRLCVQNFVEGIIYLFGDEYLRRPTPADLQRLLDIGEHRGFPGMIGSIDWPKAVLFAQRQEAVRKDVERAFGVLQARFAIVKNPALFWDKVKIGKIMRACIILHNMIVEDERDGYTQFDVSDFQQAEDKVHMSISRILQISLQISQI
uniref:DDE Tnp4 domain-containing protein n=1 Tax=Brassica oleracea var. oleracea TaxID=109376 RepID=A0A0D3A674_BRAOL